MHVFEVAVLAVAAAMFAVALGVSGHRRGELGYWAWSWAVLIAAGLLLQLGDGWTPARAAGAFLAVLFPALQLAGAMEHVGRRVPRWLIPAFGALAVLRLAVALAGFEAQSHLVVVPFEIAALAAAGVLIHRWGATRGRSVTEWLLIVGFCVIGIAEAVDAVLDVTAGLPGVSWTVWLGIGIPVGGSQILASFDRMRRQLAESLHEREGAQQALEETNARLHAIAENAHDLIVEADSSRRIQYANPRLYEVLGYTPDEVLGRDLRDFAWDLSEFPSRVDLRGDGELVCAPLTVKHRDGSPRRVECSARVYWREGEPRIVAISRDVTERARIEDQMRKAQKLESLGLLAGGIAHDFNNLLTGILGNADMVLASLEPGDPARDWAALVVDSAEHSAQLTRQLQAYSGGRPFEIRPIDVTQEIRARAELLRASVGDHAKLELELEDGLPAVDADPTQLIQAVLNLAVNAAEACGEGSGTVRITTGFGHIEAPLPTPATGSLEEGAHVFVEVWDTGHGIDESIRDRVFDPFFTTKATGRGLGLAVVHGVVQALRGAITLDSTSQKGSCCRLLFPVSVGSVRAEAPAKNGAARGRGRILVVDDENAVLKAVRAILEGAGYEVYTARDGRGAEEIMTKYGEQIELLLLDAVMPGERAECVLERLRAHRSDLPVLLMSGYAESEATRRFSAGGDFDGFLPKPFRAQALVRVVREALDPA